MLENLITGPLSSVVTLHPTNFVARGMSLINKQWMTRSQALKLQILGYTFRADLNSLGSKWRPLVKYSSNYWVYWAPFYATKVCNVQDLKCNANDVLKYLFLKWFTRWNFDIFFPLMRVKFGKYFVWIFRVHKKSRLVLSIDIFQVLILSLSRFLVVFKQCFDRRWAAAPSPFYSLHLSLLIFLWGDAAHFRFVPVRYWMSILEHSKIFLWAWVGGDRTQTQSWQLGIRMQCAMEPAWFLEQTCSPMVRICKGCNFVTAVFPFKGMSEGTEKSLKINVFSKVSAICILFGHRRHEIFETSRPFFFTFESTNYRSNFLLCFATLCTIQTSDFPVWESFFAARISFPSWFTTA